MDQEVVEMLKCGYLEQTPKAERARGPFSLMIVFMVLDPSSLIVPVHNICMYIPLCDRQGTIGTIIRYGRGERKKETSLQYCANKNGRNFYAMLPFLSLSFYFLSLQKGTAESIPDYQRSLET